MVLFVIVVFFTLKRNLNYRSRFLPQFRSYFHCSIFKEHFCNISLLVGSSGLEPPTLRLSGVRSNHLSYEPILIRPAVVRFIPSPFGGDEEDRTPDPLRARQVLSQLSYTPVSGFRICRSYLILKTKAFKIEQH